ncbi:MAG: transposase, partial [Alphaproteobacteria bacterium]|nr:transposase [Alphaproteobacteria bacterium]
MAIIPELEAQAAIIPALLQEIAELRRRLGQDSSNSSKPPSSDGLKKPPAEKAQRRTRSLREKSGRQTAGQPGHKGATLKQTDKPDAVIDHYPKTCGGCGAPLPEGSSEGYVRRQQIDLPPPPPPVVTEHRAHGCRCGNCGTKTQASFPEGINAPVQYGPRIRAIVAYLLNKEHFPEDRLEQAMSVLFGLQICSATIASFSRSCASRLEAFANALRDLVCTAPVKHMDETGFRVGARTQWLHVACTTLLTFYRVSNRGSLLQGVLGIIVHDHWKTYYTMP